jgi:hypothetical protein
MYHPITAPTHVSTQPSKPEAAFSEHTDYRTQHFECYMRPLRATPCLVLHYFTNLTHAVPSSPSKYLHNGLGQHLYRHTMNYVKLQSVLQL